MNGGLLDIRPPAAPADPLLLVWLVLALAVLLLAATVLFRCFRKTWRLRLALYLCRRQLVAGRLAPRMAADRLAKLLRQRFPGDRLGDADRIRYTAEFDRQHWRQFLARLEVARFSRHSLPHEDIRGLLREGAGWLRRVR